MNFIIIIPARYASVRLSKKVLADINGKPMIVHVLRHAYESGANKVIIATDHIEIANVVKIAGGEVCMTCSNHQSGTERLAEVVDKYNFNDDVLIVNLQADEPMIQAKIIQQVAYNLVKFPKASMTTAAVPIYPEKAICNSNIVKVVLNKEGYALYFSRTTIPWNTNYSTLSKNSTYSNFLLRHIGVYAYRVSLIKRYISWKSSVLEQMEMLEQLRILWYGEKIHVTIAHEEQYIGVDTQEDLERVRMILY